MANKKENAHKGDRGLGCSGMFGREHGAATSRTGPQRLGKDAPRHPSRDEDSAESVLKHPLSAALRQL